MKQPNHILLPIAATVCCLLAACQGDDQPARLLPAGDAVCWLRLDAYLDDYRGGTTRATGHQWQQGDCVLLRFRQGGSVVSATATYQADTELWAISTNNIFDGGSGTCTVAYIPGHSGGDNVSLSQQQALYLTDEGTYQRDADVISVRATMRPVAARLRLKGQPQQNVTISGLRRVSSYSNSTGQPTWTEAKLSLTVGTDGCTPSVYVLPADEQRRLVMDVNTGVAAYAMTLATDAMQPAASGFITLPGNDGWHGWTLVNRSNLLPITAPQVTAPAGEARSTTATFAAQVSDLGNGSILGVGFIVATDADPTPQNGTVFACGTAASFTGSISGLEPQTTYHVRAYVRNELTTTLGPVATFTTTEPDSFDLVTFGSEEDWNEGAGTGQGGQSSGSTILGRNDFGSEEDWNEGAGTGQGGQPAGSATVGRNDFGTEEDWNEGTGQGGQPAGSATLGRTGFGPEQDWN